MKTIHERRLLDFTCCPLRVGGGTQDSPIERVADGLVQQVSALAYEGNLPSLSAVRERAEALFLTAEGFPDSLYARQLIRLSRRIHDLFTLNSVLHPESIYQLDIGGVTIEGSVTVLRAPKRANEARVLRLRLRDVRFPLVPDAISLSRWLYGAKESGYPDCAVYNYGILHDNAARETFSESQVQKWLLAITGSFTQRRAFPVPGSHCKGCTRPCQENASCNPMS